MENQYGIAVANKYNLFLEDNDENILDHVLQQTQDALKLAKSQKALKKAAGENESKGTKNKQNKEKVSQGNASQNAPLVPAAVDTIPDKIDNFNAPVSKRDGGRPARTRPPRSTDIDGVDQQQGKENIGVQDGGRPPRVRTNRGGRRGDQGSNDIQGEVGFERNVGFDNRGPRQFDGDRGGRRFRGGGGRGRGNQGGDQRSGDFGGVPGEVLVSVGFGGQNHMEHGVFDQEDGGEGSRGSRPPRRGGSGPRRREFAPRQDGDSGGFRTSVGFGQSGDQYGEGDQERGGFGGEPRRNRGFGPRRGGRGERRGGFGGGERGGDRADRGDTEGGMDKEAFGEWKDHEESGGGGVSSGFNNRERRGGGPYRGGRSQRGRRFDGPSSNGPTDGQTDGGDVQYNDDKQNDGREKRGFSDEDHGTIEHWSKPGDESVEPVRGRVFSRRGGRGRGGFGDRNRFSRGRNYDRQPHSEHGGVKPVDKREGSGAHNWGTMMDDLDAQMEGHMETGTWAEQTEAAENRERSARESQGAGQLAPVQQQEDEVQFTLDEFRAQQESKKLKQPEFKIRQAGEGCKEKEEWKKMHELKRKQEEEHEDEEEEVQTEENRHSKHKNILPIEIKFADNMRRGGGTPGGGSGSAGRGGPGRGRGGRNLDRGSGGYDRRSERDDGGYRNYGRGGEQRGQRRDRAPNVADENDFPSLGAQT